MPSRFAWSASAAGKAAAAAGAVRLRLHALVVVAAVVGRGANRFFRLRS
jgi:hypothetical protein